MIARRDLVVIERYAEPLSADARGRPQRGQLHQTVFINNEQVPELSHPLGSPAPWATVRARQETVVFQ